MAKKLFILTLTACLTGLVGGLIVHTVIDRWTGHTYFGLTMLALMALGSIALRRLELAATATTSNVGRSFGEPEA